jgi:hypothetical protein
MKVDQHVLDDLRRMLRDGATPSRLIRHVIAHQQDDDGSNLRFRLTDYFHDAFRVFLRGLPVDSAKLSDEYSNSYHNQFLLHRIVQQRPHWDQDSECTWLGDRKATDEGELNDSIDLKRQPELAGVIDHLDERSERAIKMAMGNCNALYELVQILAALAERLQDKIDRLEAQIGNEVEPVGATVAGE